MLAGAYLQILVVAELRNVGQYLILCWYCHVTSHFKGYIPFCVTLTMYYKLDFNFNFLILAYSFQIGQHLKEHLAKHVMVSITHM